MNVPAKVPKKPAIVLYQEQIDEFDELPYPGGLMAQPHILMGEIGLAKRVKKLFERSFAQYQSQQGAK
jgi:hypothetical protein